MIRRPISRRDVARGLEAAGVEPGMVLLVHSSLRQVGWMIGGSPAALNAFRDVLGPSGTLVMPTFSFSLTAWGLPAFDPGRTPSRTGLLTDTFWREEGVLRSCHPTHSFAAQGPLAADLLAGPVDYEPLGTGGPIDRIRQAGGRILLLGVGHNRNSTVHLAEDLAALPYLRVPFEPGAEYDEAWHAQTPGGPVECLHIHRMPGSSEGFDILDRLLPAAGVCTEHKIGHAAAQFMESGALCREIVRLLAENPLLLLPPDSPSEITRRRRAYMESLVTKGTPGS